MLVEWPWADVLTAHAAARWPAVGRALRLRGASDYNRRVISTHRETHIARDMRFRLAWRLRCAGGSGGGTSPREDTRHETRIRASACLWHRSRRPRGGARAGRGQRFRQQDRAHPRRAAPLFRALGAGRRRRRQGFRHRHGRLQGADRVEARAPDRAARERSPPRATTPSASSRPIRSASTRPSPSWPRPASRRRRSPAARRTRATSPSASAPTSTTRPISAPRR